MSHSTQRKLRVLTVGELDYLTIGQFAFLHVGCLLLLWSGVSWVAIAACIGFYCLRIFAISAGYHRYFSHRSYKTGRIFQFILALVGCMSNQKGPLWWSAHHRYHHAHSDNEDDIHSPANMDFGGRIAYGFFRFAIARQTQSWQQISRNTLNCDCWISFTLRHLSWQPLCFSCSE